jgi:neutral ceramidase
VRYPRVGAVRLVLRTGRASGRRVIPLARQRLVRFRRPGTKVMRVRTLRTARAFLRARARSCAGARVVVRSRSRRYRRTRGRPLFSVRNRSRRSRSARSARVVPGCPAARRPGGAAGGAGPVGGAPGGAPVGGGGPGGGSTGLRAGAANTDITPPVGTPMFAYTARSLVAGADFDDALQVLSDPDENLYATSFEPSRGIHTRVSSRALVLEQAGKRFALVQVDLGGIPFDIAQEVAKRIAPTGVTAERLMISATHTHSSTGPIWPPSNGGYALLGGDLFQTRIFELTAEGIAESIRSAAARLEPARIGLGSAELRNASRNRAFGPFRRNADVPRAEPAVREASIDPHLAAIRVDAPNGRPIALWSNFAVHQTSFGDNNLLLSGDNAATAVRNVDREIARDAAARGVPAPAGRPPVTVWTNSSEGDISPNGDSENPDGLPGEPLHYVPSDAAKANLAGTRLGEGILRAWRDSADNMTDTLPIDARRTFLPFDGQEADGEPVGPHAVLGAGGIAPFDPPGAVPPEGGGDGLCAPEDDVAGPGQGRKYPALLGVGLVPQTAPVSLWRVGPLGIAGYPSEITKQMGKRIADSLRAESPAALRRVVIAGLTNGYLSYTATPEEYDGCQYEGSFTLFGRRQGPRYLAAARSLVRPLVSGQPAPPGGLEPPQTALGTPNASSVDPTPDPETVVSQPGAGARHGRVTFSWKGGAPAVDAARGRTFVELQRERAPGVWRRHATDDGPSDTTAWDGQAKAWTETFQFGTCDPPGRYRFVVSGLASRSAGAPATPYTVRSATFELAALSNLEPIDATVSGTTARARFRYANPGEALLALPRRVRSGVATLRIRTLDGRQQTVTARADPEGLAFTVEVPPGSTVLSAGVSDACGNVTP